MRLAYARTLVADKKFPEARGQFEQLLKDNPGNTDVVFAVAVLSMQLEDWPGAEANLKRLLDLGYARPQLGALLPRPGAPRSRSAFRRRCSGTAR